MVNTSGFRNIYYTLQQDKWFTFSVIVSFYFISYLYRVSTAVIAPDLVREFHIGPDILALLSSTYFYTFALAQFPLGPALDRIGPRFMCFSLGIVAAIGAVLFGMAPNFVAAVCGRALIGIGVSVAYMGTLKIVAHWFLPNEFAMMSALAMAIGNAGALSATFPLALLSEWVGWRPTFLLLSILTMLSAGTIWVFVRNRPPAQPVGPAIASPQAHVSDLIPVREAFLALIGEKSFWFIGLLEFFWFGSFIAIQGLWGGPYLMDIYGLSATGAGSVLAMIAFGFIIGGPFLGRLSDRVVASRKKLILVCLGIYVFLILMMTLKKPLPHPGLLYALFFLFGFVGASGVIGYAHVKELFPLSISGTVMTCVNFFAVAGGAVVQHIMGYIVKAFSPQETVYSFSAYRAAFFFCIVGMVVSLVFYSFSHERERQ